MKDNNIDLNSLKYDKIKFKNINWFWQYSKGWKSNNKIPFLIDALIYVKDIWGFSITKNIYKQ